MIFQGNLGAVTKTKPDCCQEELEEYNNKIDGWMNYIFNHKVKKRALHYTCFSITVFFCFDFVTNFNIDVQK